MLTTTLTRREWHGLVIGGLVAAPFARLDARQEPQERKSRIAGVRIGAQSYSFQDRSLDATIEAMASIGLSYCELWSNHVESRAAMGIAADLRGPAVREATRTWRLEVPLDHFTAIRKKFEAAGITLTAYNLSFGNDFTDEEIARGFEMARALGVPVITASSRVSIAPRLDPFAKRAGITVGFHNHSNIRPDEFATPESFAAAMTGTSDRMAVNLDIGHFTAANFDAVDYLDRHHDRIVSLHIKDRRRDQGPNLPFGEGETPIAAVLTRLRDRKWDIPAQIEYEYRGQDTVTEVKRSLDYCRKILEAR
jgi:sugar phosphate isomerase/epimerase